VSLALALAITLGMPGTAAPGAAPLPSRCQLLQAILAVPHSGARQAFRDLECVRKRIDPRKLVVRAILTDDAGTRPLLAPGERCPEGYVGLDPRLMSRSRRSPSFVELRLSPRGADLAFSVLLETWGAPRGPGVACAASGDGVAERSGGRWRVR
jgi:hypothetical protein